MFRFCFLTRLYSSKALGHKGSWLLVTLKVPRASSSARICSFVIHKFKKNLKNSYLPILLFYVYIYMKAILFLISITATSCMSSIMDDEYTVVDPKLAPYIESFKQEATNRGFKFDYSRLKLTFGKMGKDVGAVTDHSLNSITVDSTCLYWKIRREEMLYHEFGHLFLNRGHEDNEPSLMATKGVSYKNKREYYIDELFNGQ